MISLLSQYRVHVLFKCSLTYFDYFDRNNNTDNTALASERCECILAMLSRSGFEPRASIFPFDDETTHPLPDFWLNLVLSVAIIIGDPSYIIVARLSR